MPTRRLLANLPFWILLAGSAAAAVAGWILVTDRLNNMTATLTDNTATTVDVYAGQSWVSVGSALLAIGGLGLVATLAVAAVSRLTAPTTQVTPAAPLTEADDAPLADVSSDAVTEESTTDEPWTVSDEARSEVSEDAEDVADAATERESAQTVADAADADAESTVDAEPVTAERR